MSCCNENTAALDIQYENILIEKTKNVCPMCEDYSQEQSSKPVAIANKVVRLFDNNLAIC